MRYTILCLLSTFLAPAAAAQAPAVGAVSRWGAEYFSDVVLTTHEGKTVRFFHDLIEGKVVVINFIYTSCPDACPLETARLAEVQDVLGERVGQDVFMYSISIDPERDTVAALAEYAERFGVGPGWLFLRGTKADVRLVREKLGMIGADETELKDHSLSVVVGNQATGRWMRRSPFENAFVLANEIGSSLHNWKLPPPSIVEPEPGTLGNVSRGEQLFRTRCSACHVIGNGDGLAHLGPNLQGVVEWRERAWLERWIAEPDAMLAEGDALATTLFEAYRRIPMPNMRLNELEVAALIEFMEEESERTLAAPPAPAPAEPRGCCEKAEALVLGANAEDDWDRPASSAAEPAALGPASVPEAAPMLLPAGRASSPRVPILGFGLLIALGSMITAASRHARSRAQV